MQPKLPYHFYRLIAGGMKGADIGLGWIDQKGQLHFQVSMKLCS